MMNRMEPVDSFPRRGLVRSHVLPRQGLIRPGDGMTDMSAGAWKVFYSNAAGDVTELALGTAAQLLTSNGAAAAPSFQAPATKTNRVGLTWWVNGTVSVPNKGAGTGYINTFFVSLAAGQTAKLVSCKYIVDIGTSVTAKIQVNGVDATGFTGIVVGTTAASTDPADVALAEGDALTLVVTSISGTPQNMSFTAFLDLTA